MGCWTRLASGSSTVTVPSRRLATQRSSPPTTTAPRVGPDRDRGDLLEGRRVEANHVVGRRQHRRRGRDRGRPSRPGPGGRPPPGAPPPAPRRWRSAPATSAGSARAGGGLRQCAGRRVGGRGGARRPGRLRPGPPGLRRPGQRRTDSGRRGLGQGPADHLVQGGGQIGAVLTDPPWRVVDLGPADPPGQPEVGQIGVGDRAVLHRQQDVARLDVAVDQPAGVGRPGRPPPGRRSPAPVRGPAAPPGRAGPGGRCRRRSAWRSTAPVGLARVIDRQDVGMVDGRRQLRLAQDRSRNVSLLVAGSSSSLSATRRWGRSCSAR
jgi:hypothetical protein